VSTVTKSKYKQDLRKKTYKAKRNDYAVNIKEKKQIQKTIKPNNWKESGTKFTQKQRAQNKHGDKKHLQKQHKKFRE